MELGFTWFDFAALVVLGLSGVMAFARGLIREVFTVIAFIGGIIAALFLNLIGMLQPIVENFSPLRGLPAMLAGGLGVFLIVFITITLITSTIAKTAHQSTEIGSFDRAAGLAFGILRGVVFIAVFFVLPVKLWVPNDSALPIRNDIAEARTYPIYSAVADAMIAVAVAIAPDVRRRIDGIWEEQRRESVPIPPPAEPQPAPSSGPT